MANLFEPLEARKLLATFTVTNADDAGAGSLRQAILDANALAGADIVEFDGGVGGNIRLEGTQLGITDDLTINGRGDIWIWGMDASRIFDIASGVSATIRDMTIREGRATTGAGIYNAGTLTLTRVTITDNTATSLGTGSGGGIYSTGTLTVEDSLISGNAATGTSGGSGAGITNTGTLTITNTTIRANTATTRGGGISSSGSVTIFGSTLSNNTAYNEGGGAIMALNGNLEIINSTLSGNGTDINGGAVYVAENCVTTIYNSTITANNAVGSGDGIFIETGASLIMVSTIVAGNATQDIIGTLSPGSTNNLVKDDADNGGLSDGVSGNLVGVDPLLGALEDNGGPTQTHAILAGSPAINAGIDGTGDSALDQRGGVFARVGAPDIGAYEHLTLALIVDSLGDTEDGNLSAGNLSLREALAATNGNPGADTIAFAPALNGGTILLGLAALSIADDVSVLGPGAALLKVTPGGHSRSFTIDDDVVVSIDGLSISDGTESYNDGAGILNRGILTIANTVLSNNHTSDRGSNRGGALHNSGTLTITNTQIAGNSTDGDGGAIYNSGTMSISGSTITGSIAGDDGGAIFNEGILTISNSTISGNNAAGDGGGIFTSGDLTISSSTISGNISGSTGGGVYGHESLIDISGSTISGNSATGVGGGIYQKDATLTIAASLIHDNEAANGGGVAADNDAILIISNATFSANVATLSGGALSAGGYAVSLSNCTIVNNTAPDAGGVFKSVGTLTAISTIIAGNTGGDVQGAFEPGSINNLIGNAASAGGLTHGVGGNIVGVDPLLGPLANNGGPTRTHRILPGSPAINAGANPDALATDQRGFQRVRGTAIDIGAVEFIGGPSVASLTTPSSPLPQGQSALLTAGGVTDPDGSVSGVRFYLDADGDGVADSGELLFNDTNAADGFKYLYVTGAAVPLGVKRFLAVGYDEDGVTGAARLATLSVTEPVSIGSPVGATNSVNVHRVVSVNTIGHVLVYRQGWTYENLTEMTGAPIATSPAITWVDPKNGLAYVAATSGSGLLLFTRSASGVWSFRNLTTETGASASPAGNLTHFISQRQKIVVIAGITNSGRVVAFRQSLPATSPGVHAYTFVDISADLESQGQTTPNLTGLTSYVPSWDTWHLAGVDTLGRIQSIWINTNNPAFIKWRTDNLSAITGAPALSGQLAVTLTSWGGINLTGLDGSGNMLTTWWVPRFGGQWAVSNLTTLYSGPQLVGGNLTAYTTTWGGINYVGLDSAGDVRVYWWVPSFEGTWAISRLLPSTTPDASVPTGRLTSHASSAGTLNVFGTNASGDLLRLAWQPGPGSAWAVENLSDIAVEV